MAKTYLILEAFTPQGQSISRLLKKYKCGRTIKCNQTEAVIPDNAQVIPTGANSTFNYISKHGNLTIGEITFTKESLIVYDKVKLLKIASDIGIPVPEEYKTYEDIKSFPIFYKNNIETSQKTRGIAKSFNDMKNLDKTKFLIQEYINEPATFGVGFLAQNGNLLTSFAQKEIISHPSTGGSGVIIQKFNDKKIIEYTADLLKKINYSGWGLAEYKYCSKRADYVFMEINGKFWASFEFALSSENQFAKKLFGVLVKPQKKSRIVFLSQVVNSGFRKILVVLKYLPKSYLVWRYNLVYLYWNRLKNKIKSIRQKQHPLHHRA